MQLKTLYTIFAVAVFMFIARPFIGFSVANSYGQLIQSHSLLTKSFSNRKPEDLEDAKVKAAAIKQKLSDPPQKISLTIAAVLALLFPFGYKRNTFAGQSFLNHFKADLQPSKHPYLLTGKLTI